MPKSHILILAFLYLSTGLNCFNKNDRFLTYYIFSDTSDWVAGPDKLSGGSAVLTVGNGGWTASIPGASWIWDIINVSVPSQDQTVHYVKEFYIPGAPVSGILQLNVDNKGAAYVNNVHINCDAVNTWMAGSTQTCDITPYLDPGMNIIQFWVTNVGNAGATPGVGVNPAGLLYSVKLVARVDGR